MESRRAFAAFSLLRMSVGKHIFRSLDCYGGTTGSHPCMVSKNFGKPRRRTSCHIHRRMGMQKQKKAIGALEGICAVLTIEVNS